MIASFPPLRASDPAIASQASQLTQYQTSRCRKLNRKTPAEQLAGRRSLLQKRQHGHAAQAAIDVMAACGEHRTASAASG
jgi:hypothetical protein